MSNRSPSLLPLPDGIDVFAAVVGLLVSLALVPLWLVSTGIYVLAIPIVVAGACVLYLASVRYPGTIRRSHWETAVTGAVPARITGIGLAGLVVAVTLVGERSVPVLLFAAALGTLILLQIAFVDESALRPGAILAQLLALSLVLRFAALFTTPGLIGVDSWTHLTQFVTAIGEAGSLAPIADVKYYAAPFYHLATVSNALLLDLSPRAALYLGLGTVLVVSGLFVYAGARYLTSARWALFATALFLFADHAIRWSLHLIPNSLGLVFFLGVLSYVARILHAETTRLDHVMLAVLAAAVTLTHQLSAFVTLTVLGVAVLAQLVVHAPISIADRIDRPAGDVIAEPVNLLPVFLFHLGFTAVIWTVTPSPTGEPFLVRMPQLFLFHVENLAGFMAGSGSTAAAGGAASASGGWLAPYANAAGFLLLLFVTVLGSLALFRWHRSPQASFTLVGAVGVMLVLTFVFPLFNVETHLPGRWFAFMYALMAVIGAIGLQHVEGRFPSRLVVVGLVVFAMAFPAAMMTAEKATLENPTFEEQWPRYAYAESELAAVDTLDAIVPEDGEAIRTDHPYRTVINNRGAHPTRTLALDERSQAPPDDQFVVYRSYQTAGAPLFVTSSDAVVTTQLSREDVCAPTRNHVYDNQNVLLCTSAAP